MTDLDKKSTDRVHEKLPSRVETYTDTWADAARAAYLPDPTRPDSLASIAVASSAKQLKLPTLEIVAEAPAAPVDPALAKVEQIAARLKSDDFTECEKALADLRKVLDAELAENKPSAALQKIFQLAGSEEPEVKNRVSAELNAVFKDAMDSKDLVGLKQLLTHKEPAVCDWAIKKLQDSPKVLEMLPKLAVMAEKENNSELAEAIRNVSKKCAVNTLFDDFEKRFSDPVTDAVNKIWKDNFQLSKLDDEQKKEKIKKIPDDVKALIKKADDSQQQDVASLARVLSLLGQQPAQWPDAQRVLDLPFTARLSVGKELISIAEDLQDANKNPEAVSLLQEMAISMYKESLALSPNAGYSRQIRTLWPPILLRLRDLNPARFDQLVPDKLFRNLENE